MSDRRSLEERIAENVAFYDAHAERYHTFGDWVNFERIFLGPVIGGLAVDSMLDLGAGTGHTIDCALHYVNPSTVVAVDASAGMLAQLRSKIFLSHVDTVHADVATFLKAPKRQFDLITSFGVFEFVPELPRALDNLGEWLSPGGTAVMTYERRLLAFAAEESYNNGQNPMTAYKYTREEILPVLSSQGLDVAVHYFDKVYKRAGRHVPYDLVMATKPAI